MITRNMKAAKKKILNNKGDSIAEVLIALLISSLALVMLASMITTSSKLITGSRTKLKDYYAATSALNSFNESDKGASNGFALTNDHSSVEIKIDGTKTDDYNVDYFGINFQDKQIISFKKSD